MSDLTTLQELLSRDSADLEAERLILDVTENLLELMEHEGVSRKELAERLGKSKGHVSQLLNGRRNMTLRTLSEVAYVLGGRVTASLESLHADAVLYDSQRSNAKVIEIKNYLREHHTQRSRWSSFEKSLSHDELHVPDPADTGFESDAGAAVAS